MNDGWWVSTIVLTDGCNYGYPKYLDNTNGITNLTIPEHLALAQARTYATIVKLIKMMTLKL